MGVSSNQGYHFGSPLTTIMMLRSVLGAPYFWKIAIEGPSIQTVGTQLAGTGLRLLQEGSSNTKLLAFEGLESATSISSPALIVSGPNPPHRVWV